METNPFMKCSRAWLACQYTSFGVSLTCVKIPVTTKKDTLHSQIQTKKKRKIKKIETHGIDIVERKPRILISSSHRDSLMELQTWKGLSQNVISEYTSTANIPPIASPRVLNFKICPQQWCIAHFGIREAVGIWYFQCSSKSSAIQVRQLLPGVFPSRLRTFQEGYAKTVFQDSLHI